MNVRMLMMLAAALLVAAGAFGASRAEFKPAQFKKKPPYPARTAAQVRAMLAGAQPKPDDRLKPLHIVLSAGKKDHGPEEHDYPFWQKRWKVLMGFAWKTTISTAWTWPSDEQFETADVIVFFCAMRGLNPERVEQLNAFLRQGGGAVYLHFGVNGARAKEAQAVNAGLVWAGRCRYHHGAFDMDCTVAEHPITKGFTKIHFHDEIYWDLKGDRSKINVIGQADVGKKTGNEPHPQMWTMDVGKGRIYGNLLGHFSWTFDDPFARILILRGIAWTARADINRFNDLVTLGARIDGETGDAQKAAAGGGGFFFEDRFDRFDFGLAPGWTWRRENKGAWKAEGGVLQLRALPGTLWAGNNNAPNVLLRPVPGGSLAGRALETDVDFTPRVNYEQAGLIVHADDDNYVKVIREMIGGKMNVVFAREDKARGQAVQITPVPAGPLRLRLRADADGRIEAAYRAAGAEDWTTLAVTGGLSGRLKAGLFTHGGRADAENWARFDNFSISDKVAATDGDPDFFSGKDLTGWDADEKRFWSVQDGTIRGFSDKPVRGNKFLWSKVKVRDFYLTVDVKLVENDRNSGIQFRSERTPHGARGYQADIGRGWWGKLYHEHGRKLLDNNKRGERAVKPGQWNRYEILAVGPRIWTAINGKIATALYDPKGEAEGLISFQIHGGPPSEILFRAPKLVHDPKIAIAGKTEAQLNKLLRPKYDK